MKIQFKINTESENENVSNALSNLLNPLNKLKIFTKNGNVSVMSRELARISSPLVNNILKDVPCCTSTMIFIPDVSKASVDHVINILGTGKTYFNCSSLKQIQEEVKITATMLQIDFSNIKCVGESESRDYLADVDYSSNNKYNLKEDTTEYFEYDAEPFICLKKEYIDKSIKTEPIDTLKEISVDSSKKPQQSGTVKNDLENFYKSEEIDPKKMEKQDISFSANICDCTDNSDPSPPHSKDDTEPAIEISKVVSGKELRRSSRLTNSVSSILDASCFLRPADLRKSDNVDHNSIVYTEAVQGVQKEKEEKVSSLSHCNNCKICMTESNRKSMYDENSVDTVGDDVRGDMKVDYLYVSEQSLRDDQTEGVVHDHKSTDIEDTNGNVFVDNLDVLKNLVSIKSEECLRDDSGQIDFENANLEIVVKLEDTLKFEDPVFRLNQDEQSRQFEEKDINLTSQEESVTTINEDVIEGVIEDVIEDGSEEGAADDTEKGTKSELKDEFLSFSSMTNVKVHKMNQKYNNMYGFDPINRIWICAACGANFMSDHGMRNHLNVTKCGFGEKKDYKPKYDYKSFYIREEGRLTCRGCEAVYQSEHGIYYHLRATKCGFGEKDGPTPKKDYEPFYKVENNIPICLVCGVSYDSMRGMYHHLDKKCGAEAKWKVRIPRLKHADSQDESFADLYVEDTQLLKKPSSHTSLKKCPHCEKKMNTKHLSKHIKIVHNKETAQCPHCEKKMNPGNILTHIRIVHNKETARCPHCEKKMNPGHISAHIRIVHNKETARCPHCEKKMIPGNISAHIRIVHNKKTAQCPHSDKRIAGYGLSKHIRQVHNKKKKST